MSSLISDGIQVSHVTVTVTANWFLTFESLAINCVQAILGATQRSFAAMKRRLGSKATTGIFYMERPFFNVDVELKVSKFFTPCYGFSSGPCHPPNDGCS